MNAAKTIEAPTIVTLSDLEPNSIRSISDLRDLYETRMKIPLIHNAGVTVPRGVIDRTKLSLHHNFLAPVESNITNAHFHVHKAVVLVSESNNTTNTILAADKSVLRSTTDVLLDMRNAGTLHKTFWAQNDEATMTIDDAIDVLVRGRENGNKERNDPSDNLDQSIAKHDAMWNVNKHLYHNVDLGREKQGYAFVQAIQERVIQESNSILWSECDIAAIKKNAMHARDVTQQATREKGAGLLWLEGI